MRATLENWKQIEPCNKVILPGTLKITIKEQLWNSLQLAVNCPRLCTRPVLFHVFQPDYTSSNFIRRTVLLLRLNGDSSLVFDLTVFLNLIIIIFLLWIFLFWKIIEELWIFLINLVKFWLVCITSIHLSYYLLSIISS